MRVCQRPRDVLCVGCLKTAETILCLCSLKGTDIIFRYNYPDRASSNTGLERAETILMYFVISNNSRLDFVFINDKPGAGDLLTSHDRADVGC